LSQIIKSAKAELRAGVTAVLAAAGRTAEAAVDPTIIALISVELRTNEPIVKPVVLRPASPVGSTATATAEPSINIALLSVEPPQQ